MLWLKGINEDLKDYGGFWGLAKESMGAAVEVAKAAIAPFKALAAAIQWYVKYSSQLDSSAIEASATGAGTLAADGLAKGLRAGTDNVKAASKELGKSAMEGITGQLQIQSPSKVFAEYGRRSAEGYSSGLEGSQDRAQESAERFAPSPGAGASAGSGGGGGGSIGTMMVNINLPEGMSHATAQEVAKAVTAPSILGQLTRAMREALVTQGVPTQANPSP